MQGGEFVAWGRRGRGTFLARGDRSLARPYPTTLSSTRLQPARPRR